MKNNIIKILISIPLIIISLFISHFLAFCLMIIRRFISKNNYEKFLLSLFTIGILCYIPNIANIILKIFNFKFEYLNTIIDNEMYIKICGHAKQLIIMSVILYVVTYFSGIVKNKLTTSAMSYIKKYEDKNLQISKENDLIMKEKREKAKNTNVVHCPHCGANNIISDTVGTCMYCRGNLNNK